ncbi:Hypp5481 [Branchiostoma lanceolatum]|uniref:Hypp5481 protein n=1 Tax=Branchiostoma lanceolatum TaxID=7740 RepID=A0A8J9YRX6_BRALA|nr:Hypp5481 [Branchiostoma lanceolatum]
MQNTPQRSPLLVFPLLPLRANIIDHFTYHNLTANRLYDTSSTVHFVNHWYRTCPTKSNTTGNKQQWGIFYSDVHSNIVKYCAHDVLAISIASFDHICSRNSAKYSWRTSFVYFNGNNCENISQKHRRCKPSNNGIHGGCFSHYESVIYNNCSGNQFTANKHRTDDRDVIIANINENEIYERSFYGPNLNCSDHQFTTYERQTDNNRYVIITKINTCINVSTTIDHTKKGIYGRSVLRPYHHDSLAKHDNSKTGSKQQQCTNHKAVYNNNLICCISIIGNFISSYGHVNFRSSANNCRRAAHVYCYKNSNNENIRKAHH